MRIIHTADLHLDSKMESALSPAQVKERRTEMLDTFSRLVEYAVEKKVAVILIAGDLFDKAHVRKWARRQVLEEVRTHPDIDFLFLRGNPEILDFPGEADEEVPANLKTFNEEEWTAYEYGKVVISGRELSDSNYSTISVNLILDESKLNIVALHGQEPSYMGKDPTHVISLSQFKNKFIDYLALGHVHNFTYGRLDDRGTYCYPGCLEGRSFEESGDKGFVLVEVDEEAGSISGEFVPFARRRYCIVKVAIAEHMDMGEIEKAVSEALDEMSSEDLVRVVLTGTKEMDFDIDTERLQQAFSERFYFFQVQDQATIRIDYDAFMEDRSLKGEFVRLMQGEDMPEEERAQVIELGMKAILGEDLE